MGWNSIPMCKLNEHRQYIEANCSRLLECLLRCQNKVSKKHSVNSAKHKHREEPGWNCFVKEKYKDYKDCYKSWLSSGRTDDRAFLDMKCKQKKFKYSLRRLRRKRETVKINSLALSYEGKKFKEFWSSESSTIMWGAHYGSAFIR